MNNTMKVAGVVGALLLIVLFVYASLFAWHHPSGNLSPCDAPSVVFSEFKEENNSGIYTTEILEYETAEPEKCPNNIPWGHFPLYLLDNQGNIYHETWYPFANYEGGNQFHINLTSDIVNDTEGAEYPVRIMNKMSGPSESYSDYFNKSRGYDRGMKMSVGDTIMVYGSGNEADGPAKQGWSLRIMYEAYPYPYFTEILTDDLVIP